MDAERIDRPRRVAETPRPPGLPAADASEHPAGGHPAGGHPAEPAERGAAGHGLAGNDPAKGDGRAAAGLAEFPGGAGARGEETARVDVRQEPLVVRDGCAADRIPLGRWPSDDALARSEQFAVNEAIGPRGEAIGPRADAIGPRADAGRPGHAGLLAVHAPPGTGVAEVFGDLVAAIVTERARRIAELPDPAAAFGESRAWGGHTVAIPAPALTGFEVVLAAPEASAPTAHGLPPLGTRWRDPAAGIDYFASTARLADGVGAWAMLAARLGDGPANRAFAERWWRGTIRGTDVLFPAGESMAAALRRLTEDHEDTDWPAAVARFRSAAAAAESLAAERARVAASLTRLSALEQACEEASGAAEAGQSALARLSAREPAVGAALLAAEDDYRARLASLGAHELDRPAIATVTAPGRAALRSSAALSTAVSGGLRRGRNWRTWSVTRRELRSACAMAERRRDAAARAAAALEAGLAAARAAVAEATAEVARLTVELGPLAEAVAGARQRWGDHVPDGPSQAETEDATLIEWRETSAPWADAEYATARASVFLAALDLHKALIGARAETFAANLGALMELLCAEDPAEVSGAEDSGAEDSAESGDGAALLAAWQSFFLVVPVVHVPFGAVEALLRAVGQGSLGWLLAGGAERLRRRDAHAILGRIDQAVLAGDSVAGGTIAGNTVAGGTVAGGTVAGSTVAGGEPALTGDSALRIAERAARYGTWLPTGPPPSGVTGQAGRAGRVWVGTPLRVVRGLDRATIDLRNDLTYDGLLVSDRG